jgi:predicted alpha/beta superfamily hydrolase
LYALLRDLKDNVLFNNYIAVSPSLPYNDYYITKQFEILTLQTTRSEVPHLYLTAGEMEIKQDTLNNFDHFCHILSKKDFIRLKSKIHKGVEHMGTAIPSFEEGIELIQKTN